jgi:hypothetical protein
MSDVASPYVFPSESKIEVFVNATSNISIYESENAFGEEDRIIVISRARLPQFIAWLQEMQTSLDAGEYDNEPQPTEA